VIKFVIQLLAVPRVVRIASIVMSGVFLAASTAQASAILSVGECVTTVGTDNDISSVPGETVGSSALNCQTAARSNFGELKAAATSLSPATSAKATASWWIDFILTDPTVGPNTPTTVFVPINYDYLITAGDIDSFARFAMTQDYFTYYASYSSSSNPFGGNTCPAPVGLPGCNGFYQGTVMIPVSARVNAGANTFFLTISAETGAGVADAFNTITIGNVILPDSMDFSYPDLSGNPMNFAHANPSVPEPAMLSLLGTGLLTLVARRRRKAAL
jgi:hypothetical protein